MNCSLLLLLILSSVPLGDAFSFAFSSKESSLKPPHRAVRFRVAHCRYPGTGISRHPSAVLRPCSSSSSLMAKFSDVFGMVEYSDVRYDSTSTAFDAYEWTSNMGAPAALVAAAVLVSLTETRIKCTPYKTDPRWVRFTKRLMRFLLMSSFAFEVLSILVGNMTGSMLLGHGANGVAANKVGYGCPLELVHHHHELEYLLTQISFLQGLMHWLGAAVCELLLPLKEETASARRMNKCLASWLITLVISIVSFYNRQVNFYSGYGSMMYRLMVLLLREVRKFPPLSVLWGPSFVASAVLTWRAFTSPPKDD